MNGQHASRFRKILRDLLSMKLAALVDSEPNSNACTFSLNPHRVLNCETSSSSEFSSPNAPARVTSKAPAIEPSTDRPLTVPGCNLKSNGTNVTGVQHPTCRVTADNDQGTRVCFVSDASNSLTKIIHDRPGHRLQFA